MLKQTLFILSLVMLVSCGKKTAEPQEIDKPLVYMTQEISPAALTRIYQALGVPAEGRVAVKISTGEAGGHNYLKPELCRSDGRCQRVLGAHRQPGRISGVDGCCGTGGT